MDKYPVLKFTKEEQDTIAKILPKVETYVGEVTQQWILGAKPVDFPSYQAELIKLGADKLVEVNQAAYDRYIAEMGK